MEKEHISNFHSLLPQEALELLHTTKEGLSTADAKQRQKQYGLNSIKQSHHFNYLEALWEALKNPFSLILIIATIISFYSGHILDGSIIIAVLTTNIAIEIFHKKNAYKNIELLKNDVVHHSTVLRNGTPLKISSEDLVPGDIVLLEEGSLIPADGRLIEVTDLHINESKLTGESTPIKKDTSRISGTHPILELHNMTWMGTTVTQGSGTLLVTAIGFRTQFGILSKELKEIKRGSNPFLERIHSLSRLVGMIGICIALLIFVIRFGILEQDFQEILIFSLAALVAIVPESLPTIINITLTRGARKLADKKAVVKELSTIESVGSTSVIITDKTGTLTENSMKVEYVEMSDGEHFTVTGFGWKSVGMFMKGTHKYNPKDNSLLDTFLDFCLLSNRSYIYEENGVETIIGEPTEASLLVLAQKDGRERVKILETYNITERTRFNHTDKILTTVVKKNGEYIAIAMGAPETIWSKSNATKETQTSTTLQAKKGLRTIACAYKNLGPSFAKEFAFEDMTYLGFVGMRDPIREGVKEMIQKAKEAGIRIIMATGDHFDTAKSIGIELGIVSKTHPNISIGQDFLSLSPKDQKEALKTTNIFARVTPDIKLLITKILQKEKEIVTMIGDGVNDTLALGQSDVGVAMGKSGTDAARSASSIVLLDDNFSTIVSAIFRGRHIFANIRQTTNFLLSTNGAQALVLVMATFLGMPLPLVVTQILLINLITDGIGSLPFAFKNPTEDIIPRPKTGVLLTSFDYGLIGSSIVGISLATLIGFGMFLDFGLPYAQTMAFVILSLTQIGRLIALDTGHQSILYFKGHPWLWRCLGLSISVILLVLFVPLLQNIFSIVPIKSLHLLLALGLSLFPLVTVEIYKILRNLTLRYFYV